MFLSAEWQTIDIIVSNAMSLGFGWSLSRVPIPKLVIHSSSGCVRCYWLQPFFCYHQLSANFICLPCQYFLDPSWLTVYRCYPLLLSRQSDHFYVRIGRYEGRFMPNWCMLRDHVIVNPQITYKSSLMQYVWRWRGNNNFYLYESWLTYLFHRYC